MPRLSWQSDNDGDDPFDITVIQDGESEKALHYYTPHGIDFWMPKSLLARGDVNVHHNETGTLTVTMPKWLARSKGLAK